MELIVFMILTAAVGLLILWSQRFRMERETSWTALEIDTDDHARVRELAHDLEDNGIPAKVELVSGTSVEKWVAFKRVRAILQVPGQHKDRAQDLIQNIHATHRDDDM